jgi:hypothetical protein
VDLFKRREGARWYSPLMADIGTVWTKFGTGDGQEVEGVKEKVLCSLAE